MGAPERQPFSEIKLLAPKLSRSILVVSSLSIGPLIMAEAIIGFLFDTSADPLSWGEWVYIGSRIGGSFGWVLTLLPIVAIVMTVLSFNILGEWVRDRFEPRLGNREAARSGPSA